MRPPLTPLDRMEASPFQRLAALLRAVPGPGGPVLDLSIGAPRLGPPSILAEAVARAAGGWGKYPPNAGTESFRETVAAWLGRRYAVDAHRLDLARRIAPANGTRAALFQLGLIAAHGLQARARPLVLLPNPYYHVYEAATVFAGAETRFLPADEDGAPGLSALSDADWARVALIYVCNPANPSGATLDAGTLQRLIRQARTARALIVFDECYSELWRGAPPAGALAAVVAEGPGEDADPLSGVAIVNSLSKRSSAPGLRSGFVCGPAELIDAFNTLTARGGAPVPTPILAASEALWADETHVAAARARYEATMAVAEAAFAPLGWTAPPAGFFGWLPVADGEAAARALWRDLGVKTAPGRYMAAGEDDNPGRRRLRVALVDDPETLSGRLDVVATRLAALAEEQA